MNTLFTARISRFLAVATLMASSALLSGCGGDDEAAAPVVVNPTGYYINTGDATVNADTMTPLTISDLQGMVTSTQLTMLSANEILAYSGTITVTGNSYSGTVTVYESGVATQTGVPVSGTITQGSTITGTLSGIGLGTFTLDYAQAPGNNAVDNSMVQDNLSWQPVNDLVNVNVLITPDASPAFNLDASSGTGIFNSCDFVGRIDPIVGTHLYTVSGTMSNCTTTPAVMDLPYTGLASVRGTDPNDRFVMVVTNGEYGINEEYFRQ
jgi:hypothetical protein